MARHELHFFRAVKIKPVSDGCAEGLELLEVVVSFVESLREELRSVLLGLIVSFDVVLGSVWLLWLFAGRSISLVVRPSALPVSVFVAVLAFSFVDWVVFRGFRGGVGCCGGCLSCSFGLAGVSCGDGFGLGGIFGSAARVGGSVFGGLHS